VSQQLDQIHPDPVADSAVLDPGAVSSGGPPAGPSAPAGPSSSWMPSLVVLIVGMFMSVLDTSIVNVAMPVIQTDLGITGSGGQWVSTAYSLTEGVMVPISAWLGYRFGGKRVYLLCMIGFTVASALCGLAGGLVPLIGFRILQGIPGGIIPVTCLLMLQRMVPQERFGSAMGLYGLGIVVAPAMGPTLGGLLSEYVNWRFIFFVNVPIGVVGVIAAAVVLKEIPGRRDKPLDVLGFAVIAGGLFALLLALEEGADWGWGSYPILILFAVASNLILLFVIIEKQVRHPLIDFRIFAVRQFVLSLLLSAIVSIGMFAVNFYVPQFLQGPARNFSPVDTGLALIPQTVVLAPLMVITGMLYDRFGSRWLAVIGLALAGTGMTLLSRITVDIPLGALIVDMVVMSTGLGLGMMPIMSGGLASVPSEAVDSASPFSTLTQRVSQALGLSVLTAMLDVNRTQFMADRSGLVGEYAFSDPRVVAMQSDGPAGLLPLWQQTLSMAQTQAYSSVFALAGALVLAGALLALFLPSGKPGAGATTVVH
jgi:EmrB/QacA subfamily drug resistance transporter